MGAMCSGGKGKSGGKKSGGDQSGGDTQYPEKKDENYEKPMVESEEDDDDDEVGELIAPAQMKKQIKPKTSVCAEVYGKFNQKQAYEPKVIEKDPEVREKLLERLNQAFMFSSLEDKEKEIV